MCCVRWCGASSASTTCRFRESIPHPDPTAVYGFGPRVTATPARLAPVACSALTDQISLASSFQLPIAPRIRLSDKDFTLARATPSAASGHLLELIVSQSPDPLRVLCSEVPIVLQPRLCFQIPAWKSFGLAGLYSISGVSRLNGICFVRQSGGNSNEKDNRECGALSSADVFDSDGGDGRRRCVGALSGAVVLGPIGAVAELSSVIRPARRFRIRGA